MATEHFTSDEWVDFVRQALPRERRQAMERHLSEGCQGCLESVQVWRTVQGWSRREAASLSPDRVNRTARGLFALHGPRKRTPRLLEAARLIFDSFREPLPAGVRAGIRRSRHILYKAGPCWVDLRLERKPKSEGFSVIGQVLDSSSKRLGLKDVPVSLLSGSRELTRTSSNQFGEFYLDVDAVRRPQVCVGLNQGRSARGIVVPLPALSPAARRSARRGQ